MASYVSGSEALDASELSDRLTALAALDVPGTRCGPAVRARGYRQIAAAARSVVDLAEALERRAGDSR